MKFDINVIKRKMLIKYPFFGRVVTNVKYVETTSIKTAATDGTTIYYNPGFVTSLTIEEQVFLFAHEVCHIAFNHIKRSKDKNPKLWNIATDAVINAFLQNDGLPLIEGAVNIEDAIQYNVEELYNKLLKEQPEVEQNQEENQDVGHDTHQIWDPSQLEQQENNNQQENIKQVQQDTEKIGEKESFNKNKQEKKENLKKLKQQIQQESINHSLNPNGSDNLEISNIGKATKIIDWRYILRETITYDVDWSYRNATIENGVIVPHLEEKPMPVTEVVLDTSGSINEELLRNFLRECKNILSHTRLKVGCFDTRFYGFHEIRTEEDIDNMPFQGGGGTDFNAAVNAFSRRAENKIVFTDGHASMSRESVNAIWLVFGSKEISPKGGKVIQITHEDLKKLTSQNNKNLGGRKR